MQSQDLIKAGLFDKANELRNAYYQNEVIEFARWIKINDEEVKVRYDLLK
jgi:non-canonical poly(A) RNA polymerase PAPD5/7